MAKKLKKFFSLLGPGFVTGAADDDPSGIATYSQTGAMFGYSQLWTALFTFPFMAVVQEMCGRIGLITGKGLTGVIKKHYSSRILMGTVILLFLANIINIGADLGAMAESLTLFLPIPYTVLLMFVTVLSLSLQVIIPYHTYAKYLKYLTLTLFAYVITVFIVKQDWQNIAHNTFVPHIEYSKEYIMNIIAILGTTISPYLFFWQASQEVEEEVKDHRLRAMDIGIPTFSKRNLKDMRTDTITGMLFSNIVMFFIIATTASTLNLNGITEIETAAQAAEALRPLAGDVTFALFAVGIVGTGLLAVPVLAGSAAYALAEAFKWKTGLSKTAFQAPKFYLVIAVAMVVGFFINYTNIPPFKLLYYTAILNGVCAPPLLFLILKIANDKSVMRKHVNSFAINVAGYTITIVMAGAAILLVSSLVL